MISSSSDSATPPSSHFPPSRMSNTRRCRLPLLRMRVRDTCVYCAYTRAPHFLCNPGTDTNAQRTNKVYRGEETAFAIELIARNVYVNGQYNPYARNEELKWPIPFVFFFLSLSFFFILSYIEGVDLQSGHRSFFEARGCDYLAKILTGVFFGD